MASIPQHLAEKVNAIPAKPGIYQMKDADGNIIYIGKSKALKSRVRSYFNREHEWEKIKRMVFHIHDIDFIVTDTHLEAQILECELIKKIRPMYNAQFKNDQKYKYMKIEDDPKMRPITVADERDDRNCFGPYRSKNILLNISKFFENVYPIAKFHGVYVFTYNTLPKSMEKDAFEVNKSCLIEIFKSEECMQKFLSEIENKMKTAALECRFETAVIYRDILSDLKYIYNFSIKKTNSLRQQKILIGEKLEEGYKIFYIANASILFKKKYKRLTRKAIENILGEARALEDDVSQIRDEKSGLDFEHIIRSEIRDKTAKSVLLLDTGYDIDEFISRLRNIKK
ncbi:MAG: hypothetical protein K0S71_48 [Clostridia bacterium]|nr:hypothetical protein [Clostridia bacterium]